MKTGRGEKMEGWRLVGEGLELSRASEMSKQAEVLFNHQGHNHTFILEITSGVKYANPYL